MVSGHRSKIIFFALLIVIILASFAVYFNSLSNGFVYDDKLQIVENNWIRDIRFLPEIFSSHVRGYKENETSNYYRPMMNIIFMFSYHIFGLKPWGFHLVNMLFHAGVSVLVFMTALKLLEKSRPPTSESSPWLPFVAATLFAVHPIHTEAVSWISGITDPSFTFFYLLSLYLYIQAKDGLKGGYIYSVLSFAIATLCKETALTLPIILLAYDSAFRNWDDKFNKNLRRYAPYLIVLGLYFLLRFLFLGSLVPIKRHSELSFYQNLINVFPLFKQYLEKLFLPEDLHAFYALHPIASISQPEDILAVSVMVAFIVLVLITLKKNKMAFFCLTLSAVPLLPVLYIPALGDITFAERYLYLPSVGFVILLVLVLNWIKSNMTMGTFIVVAGTIFLVGSYSAGTLERNGVWKNDYTLYADMIRKSPDAAVPHILLGHALSEKGWIDQAIVQYRLALSLDPKLVEAHNNLGNAYYRKGLLDYAIREYEIALSLNPNDGEALNNLSIVYAIREKIYSRKN